MFRKSYHHISDVLTMARMHLVKVYCSCSDPDGQHNTAMTVSTKLVVVMMFILPGESYSHGGIILYRWTGNLFWIRWYLVHYNVVKICVRYSLFCMLKEEKPPALILRSILFSQGKLCNTLVHLHQSSTGWKRNQEVVKRYEEMLIWDYLPNSDM